MLRDSIKAATLLCAVAIPVTFANPIPAGMPAPSDRMAQRDNDRDRDRDQDRDRDRNRERRTQEQKEVAAVRQTLSRGLADSISRRDINGLLDQLSKSNREKMGEEMPKDAIAQFAREAEKFDKVWSEKYGRSFTISDDAEIYEKVKVEVRERDDNGRQMAVVVMPETDGKPAYKLHLSRTEDSPWRIMLPEWSNNAEHFAHNFSNILRTMSEERLPRRENDGVAEALARFYRNCAYGNIEPGSGTADTAR